MPNQVGPQFIIYTYAVEIGRVPIDDMQFGIQYLQDPTSPTPRKIKYR